MNAPAQNSAFIDIPEHWDRRGLPAWSYHSDELLKLEITEIFHRHWQIAGHISDLAENGDYFTLDIANERALIVRGQDGIVRAFNNLCRHRGARVVADEKGHCKNAIVCPFHGWVYNLDGSLRGPARPKSFGDFDKQAFGLKPIDIEIWHGFIFIRFQSGTQGSVAETFAPFDDELTAYRTDELVPTAGFYTATSPVNWKSVKDVDNEGYHVAMAHPGLQDLYGAGYRDRFHGNGLSSSMGPYNPHAGRRWSVKKYVSIAPDQSWLPPEKQKLWGYYGLFPNAVLAVTPELVQFYQEFPVSISSTLQRGAIYRRPVESRQQRLARYLALRIDRETSNEDRQLTIWSNESMKSAAFEGFHLSDLEYGVRNYHDQLRKVIPVLNLDQAPGEGQIADLNVSLHSNR